MARPRKRKEEPTTKTPQEKRAAVKALWSDMFELCQTMVKQAKAGQIKLQASLVKEVNAFMRLSLDLIDAEESELIEAERQKAAEMSYDDLPSFDDDEPRQAPGDPQLVGFDIDEAGLPSFDE